MSNSCPSSSMCDKDSGFICGVVEGFYGRPWTTEQRKDLFQKLKKWGMDSYLYAPKDDYKHRAYWRELYTVEEAEHLTSLITAARECGITFYYALSPGLDITYSNPKEITALKRKLEQVSQFGCSAFALLFDDIEPEMSEIDKEVFQSFAHAQVSVTNEMFQHLNNPKFIVCPTQYCSARANPNVKSSEYLNTLGSKLVPEVDIMWTGTKVISRLLTAESIEEITETLKRPPVIWDNIHANDYDQKRVFLGPYQGRSPDIIRKLRGVFTNPNCEYGANFIPINTLAQWSRCSVDGTADLSNDSISADIKLETETDDGISEEVPQSLAENIYHPRRALKNAILEWLPEFKRNKQAWGPIVKPQPTVTMAIPIPIPILPSINTCMSFTAATSTTSTITVASSNSSSNNQLHALAEVNSSLLQPTSSTTVIMNSLVVETKVISEPMDCNTIADSPFSKVNSLNDVALTDNNGGKCGTSTTDVTMADNNNKNDVAIIAADIKQQVENVDIVMAEKVSTVSSNSPVTDKSINSPGCCGDVQMYDKLNVCTESGIGSADVPMSDNISNGNVSTTSSMQVESPSPNNNMVIDSNLNETSNNEKDKHELQYEDLALLCDLFYLPFEHGSQGVQLLQEFNWLKCNSHLVAHSNLRKNPGLSSAEDSPEVEEWRERAKKFEEFSHAVNRLFARLNCCNNRELLYDLYSYVWDIRGIVSLLTSYIIWLGNGHFESNIGNYTQSSYTYFSKGWKESFMSGDQEPWVFRGGLTADLQRLIPVDCGSDLFLYKPPEVPNSKIYTVRPYLPEDEAAVYSVCLKTCADCTVGARLCDYYPKLPSERIVGGYLVVSPEFCFVLEDDEGIVGYAVAGLNAKQFFTKLEVAWIPELREKYPPPDPRSRSPPNSSPSSLDDDMSFSQEMNQWYYELAEILPESAQSQYPSVMCASILPAVSDTSAVKRLIVCLLASLRANGSFGVYAHIDINDRNYADFYGKLGFVEICHGFKNNCIYMGRIF